MSTTAHTRPSLSGPAEATLPAASHGRRQLAQPATPHIETGNMVPIPDLSLERQDFTALRQAHSAIQRRWQKYRPAVLRFQALSRRSIVLHPLSTTNAALRVHLNPLRAWCRLRTETFLAADVSPPATVLLFAAGDVFATRVFDLEGQTLINELADYQPCTLDQWSSLSALASRDQLLAFCQDLADTGLICFS